MPSPRSLTASVTWLLSAGDLGSVGDAAGCAGRGWERAPSPAVAGLTPAAPGDGGRCPAGADGAAVSRGPADAAGSVSVPGQDFSIPSCQLRSGSLGARRFQQQAEICRLSPAAPAPGSGSQLAAARAMDAQGETEPGCSAAGCPSAASLPGSRGTPTVPRRPGRAQRRRWLGKTETSGLTQRSGAAH